MKRLSGSSSNVDNCCMNWAVSASSASLRVLCKVVPPSSKAWDFKSTQPSIFIHVSAECQAMSEEERGTQMDTTRLGMTSV